MGHPDPAWGAAILPDTAGRDRDGHAAGPAWAWLRHQDKGAAEAAPLLSSGRCSPAYQIRTRSSGAMYSGSPCLTPKASYQASMLRSGAKARMWPGEWVPL